MSLAPASFPAAESRRRAWLPLVALAIALIVTVAGVSGFHRVQALREEVRAARESALFLDRSLAELREAWIV